MSKRNTKDRRKRREERKKSEQQRKQLITGGILAVVIALVAVVALSSGGGGISEERQARFDLDPVLGNPDAPVSIVEYGAYGCHSCKAVHESGMLEDLLEEFDGQVNLIFRDMPVIIPRYDETSAQIAQCVLDQSNELYWRFHDQMYTRAQQGVTSKDQMIGLAGDIGADTDELSSCYDSGTHRDTVFYDRRRGSELGVRGTPTFFINGERVRSFSPDEFRRLISNALAQAGA